MDQENPGQRLSGISTLWTEVRRAHAGDSEAAREAQRRLLERYGGAVRRYLQALLRDADAADELFQEFACKFLCGGLGGADPEHGRFRNFVKGVLFHLVARYHERRRRQPLALADDPPAPAAAEAPGSDEVFLSSWRDDLLARAWADLAEHERTTGKPFYAVLRCRADHSDWSSAQLAKEMGRRLGKTPTAAGVRQTLHRAREKFAELLLEEVAHSLEAPTAERLAEELLDLGLLDYCRPALEKRRHGKSEA
jgi:RNA polymerase sigma factor (sigma-70 family)